MPDVQNVFRRGGAYWWRRTLRWLDGNVQPITLAFSLGMKNLGVARHRAAAMTAQSEIVRMGLYERVARDGLKERLIVRGKLIIDGCIKLQALPPTVRELFVFSATGCSALE